MTRQCVGWAPTGTRDARPRLAPGIGHRREADVAGNLLDDEQMAPGTISATYVDAIAVAPRGAWPLGLLDEYGPDDAHIAEYARLARSESGLSHYLNSFVFERAAVA